MSDIFLPPYGDPYACNTSLPLIVLHQAPFVLFVLGQEELQNNLSNLPAFANEGEVRLLVYSNDPGLERRALQV